MKRVPVKQQVQEFAFNLFAFILWKTIAEGTKTRSHQRVSKYEVLLTITSYSASTSDNIALRTADA